MSQTQRKQAEELRIAEKIAARLGGRARLSDADPPDAWIEDVPGEESPIPLEIVRAYQWPEGHHPDPDGGAPFARAHAQLERQSAALVRDGAPGAISVIRDAREAFSVPAVPGAAKLLPFAVQRLDPVNWVIEALRPKCWKSYPPGTTLAVDFVQNWPLHPSELDAIGRFVAHAAPDFRAVWVCPQFARGEQDVQSVPIPVRP